ncbi:sensor histidine kinase YesM [Paenibacillus baekrokdamisoli]|uniref:Sensor histidine kinase YesM n=2 Tax=Paenibacillus baekrokdamisoli TaxID=1712516 RepID=A0A3G9IWL6_9BACL|nr:histidine kinase [Paenibacillus baekrokdamisoli]MBB3072487.1 sensor histidine kinase YesM [Paenibacillus baekrokdamisoli]BBH20545.1 sensor histidine kinase YesM [Paenibacillus baekrokdamisoli]
MFKGTKQVSLVHKFSLRITSILAILVAVLIISNVYSFNVVETNMVNNSKYTMGIHINNIQNSLNSVSKDLDEVFENNIDDVVLYPQKDESGKYFDALRLKNMIISKVSNNENIDALFILEPSEDIFLMQFGKNILSKEKPTLSDYFKSEKFTRNTVFGREWSSMQINGISYEVKSFKVSDILIGAMVKADTLMNNVRKTANFQNHYVLTEKNGKLLSVSDPFLFDMNSLPDYLNTSFKLDDKYFIISEDIPEIGGISNIIERKSVFSGLDIIQWMIISLGVISIVIVPLVLISLSRQIIKPVFELVKATKEIEKGNWDYHLPPHKESFEFARLFHSFTSMTREIKLLKISSYEEKLERNKAELRYLQMQIKPHFFLNAITTISSLTYQNKSDEIRQLINYLSEYLRYTFKGVLVNVTIKEEIDHVKNYIHMQEIKFPNHIFHMIDIEQNLEQHMLPQFLIQTFIENTFKHALVYGDILSIFIKVEIYSNQEEDFILITIEDNGEGFPTEIIEEVNAVDTNFNDTGRKIGISNIKKTLSLLYKRDGLLKLSNNEPSGAKVAILLPYQSFVDQAEEG